ncbi:uncharacterized protein RJT21DRAFT_111124 [Scheffersomyces amazonensis]|uniref:uncharacterized protein n=1 Tax=Scheffersomyces amazonensis TaxID=1078765 RepID=UPI00315D61AD
MLTSSHQTLSLTSAIKTISHLLAPSILPVEGSTKAVSFTTNILIVGGAYSGLSTLKSLKNHFRERCSNPKYSHLLLGDDDSENRPPRRISITVIEPRSGLLNVIGISKSMIDPEFAKTQYCKFQNLKDLSFDKVVSTDKSLIDELSSHDSSNTSIGTSSDEDDYSTSSTGIGNLEHGIEINYVHGKVSYLDDKKAQYTLSNDSTNEKAIIDFDYVIMATGRDRSWPTTPLAYNESYFLDEMTKSQLQVENNQIISVIGAGAVGIEIASDIKHKYPQKTVNLIHPHDTFPPEPLSLDFKEKIHQTLSDVGINIIINSRIKQELQNGDLITTENKIIHSNLNFWCNSHKNNTSILSSELQQNFVNSKQNIYVNEYLQLAHEGKTVPNFFVVGDLIESPIIKSAGWAMYMGRQTANNLVSLILDSEFIEPFPDLSKMPRGMVVIAGDGKIVSELWGEVELNNSNYVEEYKDYCFGKVRATLGV